MHCPLVNSCTAHRHQLKIQKEIKIYKYKNLAYFMSYLNFLRCEHTSMSRTAVDQQTIQHLPHHFFKSNINSHTSIYTCTYMTGWPGKVYPNIVLNVFKSVKNLSINYGKNHESILHMPIDISALY